MKVGRRGQIRGTGFNAFSAPLGRKGTPPPPCSHSVCMMAVPANLLSAAHEEPPCPGGTAHFSYTAALTQCYSFHWFSSPTSRQQLYPQVSRSAAKNCCQSKVRSHLQITKDKNMKMAALDKFNVSWGPDCSVPLMSAALPLHDLKLLDFSCDKSTFGNERPNLPGRFCCFGPL